MIKNMLMAASKMLDKNSDAKVQCAKMVIDEIVAGLNPSGNIDALVNDMIIPDFKEVMPPKKQASKKEDAKYQVVVQHGKLVEVKGLDLEADMEIDGKAVKYKDAIGKPFTTGKIL